MISAERRRPTRRNKEGAICLQLLPSILRVTPCLRDEPALSGAEGWLTGFCYTEAPGAQLTAAEGTGR
jgi:hypothetical protein